MSHSSRSSRIDLDAAFKAFGAVTILIGVVLTVGVLALTDPFGEYVTTTPAATGSLLFTGLLAAVGYAAYALRRR
ncbi:MULTISPECIES: hypothetical protein [Haloferacaceae]|uniref:LPXTG cell wall anchor domain-containing protein n=1 Tax=Halorubrum glutamatedens TaxID=2707018 RepID=A0ABD5QP56_9EURY|nr:hypothetical protein [Halobellus captivus]